MKFLKLGATGDVQSEDSQRWQLQVARHRLLRLIPCMLALSLTVGWGLLAHGGIESRQFSAELLVGESATFPNSAYSHGKGPPYRNDLELNARVLTPDPGESAEIMSIGDSLRVVINPDGYLLVYGVGPTPLNYLNHYLSPSKNPFELGVHVAGKRLWVEVDDVLVLSNNGNVDLVLDETAVLGPRTITGGLIDYDLILRPYAPREGATDSIIWIGLAVGIVGTFAWFVNGWASDSAPRVAAGAEARLLKSTATVVAFTTVATALGYLLGFFPYPFVNPEVRFSDLLQVIIMGQSNPYSVFASNYPPAGLALFGLATNLPEKTVITLTMAVSLGLLMGLLTASTRVGKRWWGLWPALLLSMSFPVLFALDRGNLEIAVVSCLGIGIVALLRGQRLIAVCALSLSIAIKVFPVALLPALWRTRSNRIAIFGSLVAAGAITVIAGESLGSSPPESMFGWNGGDTSVLTLEHRESWGFSLTTGILVVGHYFLPSVLEITDLDSWLGAPQVRLASLIMLAALAAWVIAIERVLWRGLTILSLGIILFQPVSFQYRAALLLVPIIFISRSPNSVHSPALIGVLMGVLLSPVGWIRLGVGQADGVTIASLVHPVTGLVLLAVLIFDRRPPPLKHRKYQVGRSCQQLFRRTPRTIASGLAACPTWLGVAGLAVGLILVYAAMSARSTVMNTTWTSFPGNSNAPTSRMIAGFGGMTGAIELPSTMAVDGPVQLDVRPFGGQLTCGGANISVKTHEVEIDLKDLNSVTVQTLKFPRSMDIATIEISGSGNRISFDSGTYHEVRVISPPACLNLAGIQMTSPDASARAHITLQRDSPGLLGDAGLWMGAVLGLLSVAMVLTRDRRKAKGVLSS